MRRFISITVVSLAVIATTAPVAKAQWTFVGPYVYGGYGGYIPFGGYGGFGPYGGFSPFGDYGFGPHASFGPWGGLGYGPFSYSQDFGQQQAALTQQIYEQQQQAIVGQIRQAQGKLEKLDTIKQQLFQKYLDLSDSERAAVRTGLIGDYLRLDAHGREGWKRDEMVRTIIGKDLPRLDGVAEFQELSESDKIEFRQAILRKYRLLPLTDQRVWQNDQVVAAIMGKDWWLK